MFKSELDQELIGRLPADEGQRISSRPLLPMIPARFRYMSWEMR